MYRYFSFFLIISLLNFFSSCTNSKTTNTVDSKLIFQTQKISKSSTTCAKDSNQCATAILIYPIVQGEAAILKNINDTINYYVSQSIGYIVNPDQEKSFSPKQAAENFVKEYDDLLKKDDVIATNRWATDTKAEIIYQTIEKITMAMDFYSYTGGAHGNYGTTLVNFNAQTGTTIQVKNQIADMEKFLEITQAAFKVARGLDPTTDLKERFFWGEDFSLPANMGYTETGIRCIYNIYEIAPYALGPTDFIISYSQLDEVMK